MRHSGHANSRFTLSSACLVECSQGKFGNRIYYSGGLSELAPLFNNQTWPTTTPETV